MDGLTENETSARWTEIIESGGKCSEAEYTLIRKMITAGLSQSMGGEQIHHPLSLVDPALELSESGNLTGVQRDYVEGIKQYAEGYSHFNDVVEQHEMLSVKAREQKGAKEEQRSVDQEILDLHLQVAKLQKEQDHRRAVLKYLRELEALPAAQPDFLDPEVLCEGCSAMPEMPREMISGFATDHSATDNQAEELLQNLKKHVLRSKLMAQRRQADHERSQAGRPTDLSSASPEAKLHALNAVKNELISWIETQLLKAGDDGADTESEEKVAASSNKYDHEGMMAGIQQKYQRHLELRQQILNELAQLDHVKQGLHRAAQTDAPQIKAKPSPEQAKKPAFVPEAYLLTPYIEQLQTLARQQKSIVQEKSQINGSLAQQHEDTRDMLDRLAEQSQLLSSYPVAKEPVKHHTNFEDDLVGRANIGDRVQPWIHAADSAKLATLEEVAENVEVGMGSVDEARTHLQQVCKLLNIPFPQIGDEATRKMEAEDEESSSPARKVQSARKGGDDSLKTIWDILDGNLGSINE